MTESIAQRGDAALGGPRSVLVRQKRDHVELDRLIRAAQAAHGTARQRLLNQLCRLVFPHAFAEESVLWPALRRMLADGEAQTLEIEKEHQQINELFARLEQLDPDSSEHHELFDRQIVDLLRQDVRDEEDHLFPELRRIATDQQLHRLGRTWSVIRHTAPTRPHPVVARRPPGNVVAALPLTVIDRARDTLDRVAWSTSATVPIVISQKLAGVAGRIERLAILRRGERPATRIEPDHPPS